MARITISLPEEVAEKAARRAEFQKRSASSYIALLIEEDLRAAGLLAPSPVEANSERLAKLASALLEDPALAEEVDRLLSRVRRARRRPSVVLATA